MVEVRQLGPEDWKVLRELRLSALLDAPSAFYSTYEDSVGRDESGWREWPHNGAAFAAWSDGEPVGMVGLFRHDDDPGVTELIAMWVSPAARGTGAADALVGAVLAWAERAGCAAVDLEVAARNASAERCYARNGFVPVDRPTEMPGGLAMRATFG
jgi:RimJ/RimL family protein N-acetyltransferase